MSKFLSALRKYDPHIEWSAGEGGEMSKHTPGPWEHIGQGHIHGHEANGGGVDIARVYLREDESKWQANARLIAAAPELADALMDLRDFCAASCGLAVGAQDVLEKARAALAKALPK